MQVQFRFRNGFKMHKELDEPIERVKIDLWGGDKKQGRPIEFTKVKAADGSFYYKEEG